MMHIAAIIAEYNPFHNGHAYQFAQVRGMGATHVIVIQGGNFTQRGEPALFEKQIRARAALACGADLVLELPLPYAVAGAQRFARGGVYLAAALNGVDLLCFGSECGDIDTLSRVADALESPSMHTETRARLAQGETFCRARAGAAEQLCGASFAQVLSSPNDILGLEYIRALRDLHSAIRPVAISRAGGRHDAPVPGVDAAFASASYLRGACAREPLIQALAPYVPPAALSLYTDAPLCTQDTWESALLAQLRRLPREALRDLPELSEGLENRLYQAVRVARTCGELYSLTKSKRYPHARVRRLALAAFLGIPDILSRMPPPYLRILACGAGGRELLHQSGSLPMGASLKRLQELGGRAATYAALEAFAGDQYALFQTPRGICGAEYRLRVF